MIWAEPGVDVGGARVDVCRAWVVQEFAALGVTADHRMSRLLPSVCPALFSSLCSHSPFCYDHLQFPAWCRAGSCVGQEVYFLIERPLFAPHWKSLREGFMSK